MTLRDNTDTYAFNLFTCGGPCHLSSLKQCSKEILFPLRTACLCSSSFEFLLQSTPFRFVYCYRIIYCYCYCFRCFESSLWDHQWPAFKDWSPEVSLPDKWGWKSRWKEHKCIHHDTSLFKNCLLLGGLVYVHLCV